ncbi:MAG TPA: hypothetical protein VMG60_03050 [Burkholderiaceae bacterium]|nr:hypothetical protein [Burkholderiaceae bacterium]
MRHVAAAACVAIVAAYAIPSLAQLPAPAPAAPSIRDPAMVVEDRGQKLEFFPTLRAAPQMMSGGRIVVHRLTVARADAPFAPKSLGVAYNHTIQAQGFLTGEITFSPKGGTLPADIQGAGYHGLRKIVPPNVYEVVARTPAELKALFGSLKARSDLEWVEIPINYGISANDAFAVLDAAQASGTAARNQKTAGK